MSLKYLNQNIDGISAIIDDEIDATSENAISSKAVTEEIENRLIPKIASGIIPVASLAKGKRATYTVPLDFKPDAVVVTLTSSNTNADIGWCDVCVIQSSISSSGFKVQFYNHKNSGKTFSFGCRWIAVKNA